MFAGGFAAGVLFGWAAIAPAERQAPAYYPKVIYGKRVTSRTTPIVQVRQRTRDGSELLCTGTLLSQRSVLTAAHCTVQRASQMTVMYNGRRISAIRVAIHPRFRSNPRTGALDNDVAILQLRRSIAVAPAAIMQSSLPGAEDPIVFYGYGLNERGQSGILRYGIGFVSRVLSTHITSLFDGQNASTCNGDSGGPAYFIYRNNRGQSVRGLVGVTSTGTSEFCEPGDTSYFVNLQNPTVFNFILKQIPSLKTI